MWTHPYLNVKHFDVQIASRYFLLMKEHRGIILLKSLNWKELFGIMSGFGPTFLCMRGRGLIWCQHRLKDHEKHIFFQHNAILLFTSHVRYIQWDHVKYQQHRTSYTASLIHYVTRMWIAMTNQFANNASPVDIQIFQSSNVSYIGVTVDLTLHWRIVGAAMHHFLPDMWL